MTYKHRLKEYKHHLLTVGFTLGSLEGFFDGSFDGCFVGCFEGDDYNRRKMHKIEQSSIEEDTDNAKHHLHLVETMASYLDYHWVK